MFTLKRLPKFQPSGDWNKDGPLLHKWIQDYFLSLEQVGALAITEASLDGSPVGADDADTGKFTTLEATGLITATGGQIKFPATQAASADANTLDDYEEGSTTPTPTSGTGTLTTATAAVGYTKIGNRVIFRAAVVITTNGTGATDIRLTVPFTAANTTPVTGADNGLTFGLMGHVTGTTLIVKKYDGTYPGGDGVTLNIAGAFRV